MKRKWFIVALVAILLILFVPIPSGTYKDGGTRVYSALTYKIVKWRKIYGLSFYMEDSKIYENTSVYFLPENYKDIDLLWEKEENCFFNKLASFDMGKNKNIEQSGKALSDDNSLSISLKGADLQAEKPYIEITWTNNDDKENCINPYEFEILYTEKENSTDIKDYKTCAIRPISIPEPAMIIPPFDSVDVKYTLADYNLSENKGQYCFMSRTAIFNDGREHFVKLFFKLSQ